ncbi:MULTISPECIES: hypothetical protein [Tessaracoccus]|uniref:hypothetical protein n=1 Tax=Tessaracoccus TaxID=72763 RepID=UPI001146DC59|nr:MULTISPECIES: hypothetical protein [Tessaracoccus]VEP38967.1 hypothetical protein TLA_TLA_00418 [Tessaracoccus lapidicaptus]
MTTTSARRLAVALASAGLLAAFAAAPPASAARSEHIVNTISDVSCVFETAETDLVFFGASASSATGESGSFMFVETLDYDTVLESTSGTAEFGADGSFSAEVDLISVASGQPVGTATVEGIRTVVGDPVLEEVRGRSGNSWEEKGTVITTDYQVVVTSVTVPGYDVQVGADDCTSQDLAFDVRTTNPEAVVYRDSGFDSEICQLAGLEFGEVRLSGSGRDPIFEVIIDDGVDPQKASGTISLRGGSGEATAELIDLITEEAIGELTISVDLARTSTRELETETFDGITVRSARTTYMSSITVSIDDGRSGTAECPAMAYTESIIMRPGSGGDDDH